MTGLLSIVASIHKQEERLIRISDIPESGQKAVAGAVEKLIHQYGEKYADGKYRAFLCLPSVCKERLTKGTPIIPKANEENQYPWALMSGRNPDPYLVVNPRMTQHKNIDLGKVLEEFHHNRSEFLRPDEFLTGLFLGKFRLNGSEVFIPLEGKKNGMLIWQKDSSVYGMTSGFSKRINFKNLMVPKCSEVIC